MYSMSRLIGWGRLLAVLALLTGAYGVSAQVSAPGQSRTSVIELTVGSSRTCQMSTRADLKRVENPNSNVVRVERIADKNNEVLLVAERPGRCVIAITDQLNRTEMHEVVVTAPPAAAPIQQAAFVAQPAPAVETVPLQINVSRDPASKGVIPAFRSVKLREAPIGGVLIENSNMLNVIPGKEDPSIVTFRVVAVGRTRVTFFYDKEKTRGDVYEVTVGEGDVALGVHQIELNVVVAVVNRSEARNMAFSWNVNGPNWYLSSLIGGPGGLASVLAPGVAGNNASLSTTAGNGNIPFGVLNRNNSFMGFLQATRNEGLTKILAEPRLVTQSGRPAHIVSGGHVDIVAAGGVSSAQISADFGTIVNFLPVVLPNGKIHLEVRTEVSTPTNSIPIPGAGGAGTVSFSVLKRAAQVSVQIEDSQTLAIGGLIQNRVDSATSKVPVLGDMPFFGAAFRSVNYTEIEEEMVILVTPRLVHPVDCTKIPRYLPGRETRGADDFELFLEGIMEAPRGQRNVVFHPHYYKPAFQYAPNAGQIPCGDGNCNSRGGCYNGNCAQPQTIVPTSGSSMAMPTPSFPELQMPPASNSRVIVEPELPGAFPPIRDNQPNLGPVIPTSPTSSLPPARQQLPSQVLPPLQVGPNGR